MNQIIKIVIKGDSGYGCIDEAYRDKVTVTPESIAYEYTPQVESELNPKRKWSYKTNSPIFHIWYQKIESMIPDIMNIEKEPFCLDIGSTIFVITYADKKKATREFYCDGDYFKECFNCIKEMVPSCEYVPAVLLTDEDYNEDE